MRARLITALAFSCTVCCAAAAQTAMPVDWSGVYAGGNIGLMVGGSDVDSAITIDGVPVQASSAGISQTHLAGGAVAGFGKQLDHLFVGVEVGITAMDFDRASMSGELPGPGTPLPYTTTTTVKGDWIATFRPRIGWAADNWLLYATGGLALTRLTVDAAYAPNFGPLLAAPDGGAGTTSASETKVGWTIGAGGEYALDRSWSLTAQYLFVDFGSVDASAVIPDPAFAATSQIAASADLSTSLVLVGASYRFGRH